MERPPHIRYPYRFPTSKTWVRPPTAPPRPCAATGGGGAVAACGSRPATPGKGEGRERTADGEAFFDSTAIYIYIYIFDRLLRFFVCLDESLPVYFLERFSLGSGRN